MKIHQKSLSRKLDYARGSRGLNPKSRRGSMSLEVLATLGVILPMAVAAFNLARLAYQGLYFIISTWIGSPFF